MFFFPFQKGPQGKFVFFFYLLPIFLLHLLCFPLTWFLYVKGIVKFFVKYTMADVEVISLA